jgi:hypothetical protein
VGGREQVSMGVVGARQEPNSRLSMVVMLKKLRKCHDELLCHLDEPIFFPRYCRSVLEPERARGLQGSKSTKILPVAN